MRTHTNDFKEELKVFGRQIQGKIIYYPSYDLVSESDDNILTEADLQIISEQANYDDPIEINAEDIFSISIIKNGDLLQSLMKEFDFETKVELNIGSVVNPQLGLLVNGNYEYLNYGNYIINSKEFNMDTETWSYVCYDKMLFSMVKYRGLSNIEYPITIKQFINKLCDKVGLEFEDSEFVNQDQLIYEDLYKNRDVTYRDIFDEISKIVAGNLLINDSDKLEVGYPNKASYSENANGSDITIEAKEEKLQDVKLEGETQQATLPSEYTAVDYIESSGTQYIDIGVKGNNNFKIKFKYEISNFSSNVIHTIGDITNTSKAISFNVANSAVPLSRWGNASTNQKTNNLLNVQYIADISKEGYYINGNLWWPPTDNVFTTDNNLYLFGANGANAKFVGKIYSCIIDENNILIRNFIPCIRNSDNEVGMYDLVTNTFYTNQGTGVFTYGSVVTIPNPNQQLDINVVTDEQNVTIQNKNLYDKSKTSTYTYRTTATINDDKSVTITATGNNPHYCIIRPNVYLEANTTYRISFNVDDMNGFDHTQMFVSNSTTAGGYSNTNSVTYTPSVSRNVALGVYLKANATITISNIQIEKGNTTTSYEEYKSQNYPINLGNIELCKIGDYQDYIYEQNGDWYIHKEIVKVILTENSYWSSRNVTISGTSRTIFFSRYDNLKSNNSMRNMMCNYFKVKNTYGTSPTADNQFYNSYERTNNLEFTKFDTTTLDEWKEWVASHNIILFGKMVSPTDTQITDTNLIQQLNNLKNATLYNGVNNISVDGELPIILNLDYISEYESINEDYLKDTNVRMSEKIGVINSVAILDSDNDLQYIAEDTQSIKENQMTRVTITDNLIAMNGETQEIADNILNKLNGLYYYANDLQTTGVCYYDFLDMFNVEARGNIYQCLLLNNEITITQGIEEHIFTERFEELETSASEYTTSVITNKQVQFKINQQEGRIESKVEKDGVISAINQSAEEIQINADKLSLEGKNINLTGDNIKITGDNLDIDSSGVITLIDNNAGALLQENAQASYIIQSEATDEYQGQTAKTTFINRILSGGKINEYENDSNIEGSGYGHYFGGIQENIYRYPTTKWYMRSADYDVYNPSAGGTYNAIEVGINQIKSTSNVNGTSTEPFIINANGRITCVSLTQTSKEKNKKNFEKLTNAKDILNQVDIYKYNFKDEDDNIKKSIGFVIGDNFNYSEEITSTNNDGANIYSMVSVLWQVVKEQQEEINELKEMIKNGKY